MKLNKQYIIPIVSVAAIISSYLPQQVHLGRGAKPSGLHLIVSQAIAPRLQDGDTLNVEIPKEPLKKKDKDEQQPLRPEDIDPITDEPYIA